MMLYTVTQYNQQNGQGAVIQVNTLEICNALVVGESGSGVFQKIRMANLADIETRIDDVMGSMVWAKKNHQPEAIASYMASLSHQLGQLYQGIADLNKQEAA